MEGWLKLTASLLSSVVQLSASVVKHLSRSACYKANFHSTITDTKYGRSGRGSPEKNYSVL